MSPTLMEGAIAVVIIWIAWRIGSLLAPRIMTRLRQRRSPRQKPPDQKNKPPLLTNSEK